jgi:2,5-diketo-D-gluconate reductase A
VHGPQRLGLDYLDLYLIHQPFGDYYSAWRAMPDLHRQGGIKAIGVSNFHPDRLVDLIERNEITPAVDQVETHRFHARVAEQELRREPGVQIESWGPFAEGKNGIFTNPTLTEIAEAHGKSVAQVVQRSRTLLAYFSRPGERPCARTKGVDDGRGVTSTRRQVPP